LENRIGWGALTTFVDAPFSVIDPAESWDRLTPFDPSECR